MGFFIDTYRLNNKKIPKELFYDNTIKSIELSKGIIRYKIVGNGNKTIVFIPDAPNTIEHYEELCALLKNNFTVIVFELPGFGFSSLKTTHFKFSLQESTEMCVELLIKLNFQKYILAFPCVTGFVALNIVETEPELIDGLVLIQTPSFEEELKWYQLVDNKGLFGKPVIGQLFNLLMKRKVAKLWYKSALPKNNYDEHYLALTEKTFKQGSEFCLASAFQGIFKNKNSKSKYTISNSIQTLVIWGNSDRSHKSTNKKSIEQYITNPDYLFIEESGHFPELEFAKDISQAIIKKFTN